MALTQFGEVTRTLILKHESHKLHHEFEASEAIKKGQPVVLNSDGTVKPAGTAAAANTVVGYSMHTAREAGDLVTIMMKPFLIVFAQPNAALVAGPVAYDGQNTAEPDFASFAAVAAGAATAVGFALDEATAANDVIRVALL